MILNIRIFLCRLFRSPRFIIKIEKGLASVVAGKVKQDFVYACQDVAGFNNLRSAFIFATIGPYEKTTIYASNNVSKEALQQLRNAWNA